MKKHAVYGFRGFGAFLDQNQYVGGNPKGPHGAPGGQKPHDGGPDGNPPGGRDPSNPMTNTSTSGFGNMHTNGMNIFVCNVEVYTQN